MSYRPCGFYVLVEMEIVENKIAEGDLAGFQFLSTAEQRREQEGQAIGVIRSFGPTCFKGYEGCEGPSDWGVEEGERIEFNRYDGKKCLEEGYENYRLIADSDIIAVLESEND